MTHQKAAILDKAMKHFSNWGIRSFTMDDLAHTCGISKKTLYSNFENKHELVDILVSNFIHQFSADYHFIQESSENAIAEIANSLATLENVFKKFPYRMLEELEKYYHDIWIKLSAFIHEQGLDFVLVNLKRGQQEELYVGTYNNMVIARMRIHQLSDLHRYSSSEENIRETLLEISRHYLSGLATAKGRRQIHKHITTKIYNQ